MTVLVRYDLAISLKILSSLKEMEDTHYNIRKEEAGLLRNSERKKDNKLVKRGRITKVKLY